jgi:hypothetical protein
MNRTRKASVSLSPVMIPLLRLFCDNLILHPPSSSHWSRFVVGGDREFDCVEGGISCCCKFCYLCYYWLLLLILTTVSVVNDWDSWWEIIQIFWFLLILIFVDFDFEWLGPFLYLSHLKLIFEFKIHNIYFFYFLELIFTTLKFLN